MSKIKTIYLCPITNTPCNGCGGDIDCRLQMELKVMPIKINTNMPYKLSTAKSKPKRKIQQALFTFSKFVFYTVIAYCILVILGMIVWLL